MNELLRYLLTLTVASSTAIVIALSIRRPIQRAFGSVAACSTWLLVPAAMVAAALPSVPGAGSAIGLSFESSRLRS
jgi:beta-lactamase regulating signal transducer with metallopeptidase domain